jgi:hypothetical protein
MTQEAAENSTQTNSQTIAAQTNGAAEKPLSVEGAIDTLETRAAALIEKINRESAEGDEAEGETTEETPAETVEAKPAKPAKAAKAAEKPATEEEERRARVERAAALERENTRLSRKHAEEKHQLTQLRAQLDAEKQQIQALRAEFETKSKMFEDPGSLLDHIAEKIPPQQLADWFLQAKDPAKQAEWATKRAMAKLPQQPAANPELERRLAELENGIRSERLHAEQSKAEASFMELAKSKSEAAPHVASLLERRPQQLIRTANEVADYLKTSDPDWGDLQPSARYEKIVEYIEADLSGFVGMFAPSSSGETNTRKDSAEAPVPKARTLTSRTSAGRSQLVDEDEIAKLSLEGRAEHLKRLAKQSK